MEFIKIVIVIIGVIFFILAVVSVLLGNYPAGIACALISLNVNLDGRTG